MMILLNSSIECTKKIDLFSQVRKIEPSKEIQRSNQKSLIKCSKWDSHQTKL